MKREARYVVLKLKDIDACEFTDATLSAFNGICDRVNQKRISQGKGLLECVVIESDWPEFEPTWAAIEKRVDSE